MLCEQRLMVCSNTWLELFAKETATDQEWLRSNSVVVEVNEELCAPDAMPLVLLAPGRQP